MSSDRKIDAEMAAKPFEPVAAALDDLGNTIEGLSPETRTLTEIWGFQFPAITRNEIALMADALANRFRNEGPEAIEDDEKIWVTDALARIQLLKSTVVPQLFAGNPDAITAYLCTLYSIEALLADRFMRWSLDSNLHRLPPKLVRRINAAETRIDKAERDAGLVEGKVATIIAAHEAADQLDVDLESLRKASAAVKRMEEESIKASQRIDSMEKTILQAEARATMSAEEASAVVDKCDEAYRITTSQGLAAAFDSRAEKLRKSTNWWAGWLALALISGAGLGLLRISALSTVLANEHPNWGAVALHMVLSVVSVGAPLWFAWMATKQIQQRFKLAEDYAFKASVAKAYEGYRKEAADIDEAFVSRLFASALTRLEEVPLRMIDGEKSHGGPYHELVHSDGFKAALEKSEALARYALDTASGALQGMLTKKKAANNDLKASDAGGSESTGTTS